MVDLLLTRLSVDAFECAGDTRDANSIADAMCRGAVTSGATVRQQVVEQFNPHGVTCCLVLAESHLVVSTWPEYNYASIDAALCNPALDVEVLIEPVVSLLQPKRNQQQMTTTPVANSVASPVASSQASTQARAVDGVTPRSVIAVDSADATPDSQVRVLDAVETGP